MKFLGLNAVARLQGIAEGEVLRTLKNDQAGALGFYFVVNCVPKPGAGEAGIS